MRLTRHIGLWLRVVAGTAWAWAMCVAGLLVLTSSRGLLAHVAAIRWPLGAALTAGGLFVFMVLVADRWFRRASKPMIWTVELLCLGVFLGAPAAAVLSAMVAAGD